MNEDVNDEETVAVSAVEEAVLDLLDQDIIAHPERLQPITAELARRVQSLVGGVSVEFDIPLPPDDE
jgi:antitoxin PrlF